MSASDAALIGVALAVVLGCDEPGPPPELRSEIATLREILREDPATAAIEEAERIAIERPVHAANRLEREAIPAARRQVERVREAPIATDEGRVYARRIADAYADRVRGLEQWHRYLEDAASDDAALLEATGTLRHATVTLVEVDREMDAFAPIERPRPH